MHEIQVSENHRFISVLLGSALCTLAGALFFVFMFVAPIGGQVLTHFSVWAASLLLMVPATFLAMHLGTGFAAIEKIEFCDGPYISAVATTGLIWVGLVLIASTLLSVGSL